MDLQSTYNKIAKDWMEDHKGDTWWIEGMDYFLSLLKPNSSILDIGCGYGEKSKYITEKGHRVTGIDFSEAFIALAKEWEPRAKYFFKDITNPLEFHDTFDGVVAQAVLLHIPKKEILGVLKNITEPLVLHGHLYVAVKERRPGEKDEEVLIENDYGYDYERFFSYFTMDELKNYITQSGLDIVHEHTTFVGQTRWLQVIAKKQYPTALTP